MPDLRLPPQPPLDCYQIVGLLLDDGHIMYVNNLPKSRLALVKYYVDFIVLCRQML